MPEDQVELERSSNKIPDRTLIQRMRALERGNRIRSQRAQLKRDLKTGRTSICDILLDPPAWVGNMKVVDALIACPRYGQVKANRILEACRISPAKAIGGITSRQRYELASKMRCPR
ncbi:MAG: integration host factor, actinobacterial type [Ktedonobacteraceae bacterium]